MRVPERELVLELRSAGGGGGFDLFERAPCTVPNQESARAADVGQAGAAILAFEQSAGRSRLAVVVLSEGDARQVVERLQGVLLKARGSAQHAFGFGEALGLEQCATVGRLGGSVGATALRGGAESG